MVCDSHASSPFTRYLEIFLKTSFSKDYAIFPVLPALTPNSIQPAAGRQWPFPIRERFCQTINLQFNLSWLVLKKHPVFLAKKNFYDV